jgi:hypothetical protein
MVVMLPPLADNVAGAQPRVFSAKGGAVLRWRWFATDSAGKRTAAADPVGVASFKVQLRQRDFNPRSRPSGLVVRRIGASCASALGAPAPLPGGSVVSGPPSTVLQWDAAAAAYQVDATLPKRAGCYRVSALPWAGTWLLKRCSCPGPRHASQASRLILPDKGPWAFMLKHRRA